MTALLGFFGSALGRWVLFAAIGAALYGYGYVNGVERESDRRDAEQLTLEREGWQAFTTALKRGADAVRELAAARRSRDNYAEQLRRKTDEASNRDLAVSNCPRPQDPTSVASVAPADDRPACYVTWRFVGLWDAAWTGADGQPLLGDPAGAADWSLAASPVEPRTILRNHQQNAKLCSDDRATLAKLVGLVDQLERDWEERQRSD